MRTISYVGVSPSQITNKGEKLYQKELKDLLEPAHRGKYVAIEPESGDYFVGDDPIQADTQAQEKHPEKVFYLKKIGYESAFSMPHFTPLTSTFHHRYHDRRLF